MRLALRQKQSQETSPPVVRAPEPQKPRPLPVEPLPRP